jgi:hypothetical protein
MSVHWVRSKIERETFSVSRSFFLLLRRTDGGRPKKKRGDENRHLRKRDCY